MDKIQKFADWLESRGRSDLTITAYVGQVKLCFDSPSFTSRLLNKKLSPNTRRLCRAALIAWARFTKDSKLLESIQDMRMPAGQRLHVKTPLGLEEWRNLKELVEVSNINTGTRIVLLLMLTRGFRVGDVLRLTKQDVTNALRTKTLVFTAKGSRKLSFSIKPILEPLQELQELRGWNFVMDLVAPRSKPKSRYKTATQAINRTLKALGEELEIEPDELYSHRLRRTFAAHFYDQVKDIRTLAKAVGWSNINTAFGYVDFVETEEIDNVIETL